MINKIIQKINYSIIIFLIIMMPMTFVLNNYIYKFLNITFNTTFYQLLHFIIPIEVFIYVYNLIKNQVGFSKYDIFMYILIVLGIIVTITAVDSQTSIWGAYLRNEGLLALISYYLLFLNSKSLARKEITKVINWLFCIGLIQFVYCILQVFVRGDYVLQFSLNGVNYMAMGFVGNPNFLGSFSTLLFCLAIGSYLVYGGKKYFLLTIIFYINLILAQSTGPFFALICVLIFAFIFLYRKKIINIKKIGMLLGVFTTLFIFVSNGVEWYCKIVFDDKIVSSYTIKGDLINTFDLFSSDSDKDNVEEITIENYGSGRFTIWKNTLKIVPKYFWLGAGIDNFGYVYPKQSTSAYADKAHNEYLQTLVTQGIFVLITYLIMLACLFFEGIKSNVKTVWILLFGFIGYALQAFVNISVTSVAPFFFIVIGMLAGLISKEKNEVKV